MKVERKQSKFDPVVITIETEDELTYLWHLLSLRKSDVKGLAGINYHFPENVDDMEMFVEIDKIARPEEY